MERVCFVYELKPGAEEEYEQRHLAVPDELRCLLDDAGISDYSIFRRGSMLYCFLKARPSWASAEELLSRSDVQERWTESLRRLFACIVDEDGGPLLAHEVFRHDGVSREP